MQTKVEGAVEDNVAVFDAEGFVKDSTLAVADIQKKIETPTADNLVTVDADGFVQDSGVAKADVQVKLAAATEGNVLTATADGFMQDSGVAAADLQVKVADAVENNIATFGADGFVKDSGLKLDDASTEATALWSAAKITDAITDAISGMSWQRPVKDVTTTVPAAPAEGDRYLVVGETAAADAWAGQDGSIAEYVDGAWVFYAPVDGAAVFAEDTDEQYAYNGTEWVNISAGFTYHAGNGVALENNTFSVVAADTGALTVDATGVSVNVDGVSVIKNDANALEFGNLDFGAF